MSSGGTSMRTAGADRRRPRAASSLGTLLLLAGAVGCAPAYSHLKTENRTDEQVEPRQVPVGALVDLAATRHGDVLEVRATAVPACRSGVFGTVTTYRERTSRKDACWEHNDACLMACAAPVLVIGSPILVPYLIRCASAPDTKVESSFLSRADVARWDATAAPCGDEPPAPVRTEFEYTVDAGAFGSATFRETTDAQGVARISLKDADAAVAHCGDVTFSLYGNRTPLRDVGGSAGSPTVANWFRKLPADLPLGDGSVRLASAVTPSRETPFGALAHRCCEEKVAKTSGDRCEARCHEAQGASKCLASRRACLERSARMNRGSESEAACATLYEECVLEHAPSLEVIPACVAGCAARTLADTCG